jgi:hypothetical protein
MAVEIEWLRAYVEKCVADVLDRDDVEVDDDGDIEFRSGTARVWVSVVDCEPLLVSVFAQAALGVKASAALLREVNDLNLRAVSAKVMVNGGALVVRQTLAASAVDPTTLAQAVHQVSHVANDIGHLAAAMFDGSTPYATETVESET